MARAKFAALAAAIALLAGCAGGSGSTAGSATPLPSGNSPVPATTDATPPTTTTVPVPGGAGGLGTAPPAAFGSPIGDVRCDSGGHDEAYHIHATLSVVVDGTPLPADPNIGLGLGSDGVPCMYWAHTHDEAQRLIHIEAPENVAVTLGDLIEVWRATYPRSPVLATALANLAAASYTVAGAPGPVDWSAVTLTDGLAIVIGGG